MGGGENKEEEEEEADRGLWAVKCSQLQYGAYGLTLSSLMQCSQRRAEQLYWRQTRGYAGKHTLWLLITPFSVIALSETLHHMSTYSQAVKRAAEFLLTPRAPILPSVLMWKLFSLLGPHWSAAWVTCIGASFGISSVLLSLPPCSQAHVNLPQQVRLQQQRNGAQKTGEWCGAYYTEPEAASLIFCREKYSQCQAFSWHRLKLKNIHPERNGQVDPLCRMSLKCWHLVWGAFSLLKSTTYT